MKKLVFMFVAVAEVVEDSLTTDSVVADSAAVEAPVAE